MILITHGNVKTLMPWSETLEKWLPEARDGKGRVRYQVMVRQE